MSSREINYSTPETEILSLYGEEINTKSKVFIRVDPDKTYTFSSEIRAHSTSIVDLIQSKKTLSQYLKIIDENTNLEKIQFKSPGNKLWYNLQTSEAEFYPEEYKLKYPYNEYNINRNSEILVSVPHLTPKHFVLCTE